MDFSISRADPCASDAYLAWDTVWNSDTASGDWVTSDPSTARNFGGLKASDGIATSIITLLFTDRAVPPGHPLAKYADGDSRGYWGDGVLDAATNEQPLGSLLWLLERSIVNDQTARYAETFALEALQPLIDCGAVRSITAQAQADPPNERVNLLVIAAGSNGQQVFNQQFDIVWRQRGL